MRKVYNRFGDEVGLFNGRFVFDEDGEKLYWVEEKDVFCVPGKDTETHLAHPPYIGIGGFDGEVAIDSDGEIIFSTNSLGHHCV